MPYCPLVTFRAICIATLCMSAGLSSPAMGANWQQYFVNQAGVRFSIDASSVVRLPNRRVRAWERQEWAHDEPKIGSGFLWLIEVDCPNRTYEYKDIEPIKGSIEALRMAASLLQGLNREPMYFGPNDLDEARYAAFCAK